MKSLKQISGQITERIDQFIADMDKNESILEKTIVDMKKRILEAKNLAAAAIAEAQILKRTYQETIDEAKMWRKKADAASQNGDTEGSTAAHQHEQQHLQRANDLERQINAQEAVITDLKAALKEFHQQFRNTVERAKTLSQRQKQAETRAEFYKLLAEFDLPDNNVFQQAEHELQAAETEAKLWEERNRRGIIQTETPENNSTLDEALADLKRDILGSSQND